MLNKTLQTTCDTFLADVFEQVKTLQEKYKTEVVTENMTDLQGKPTIKTYTRDKYFQLLETHSTIPADGITKAETVDGKKPTDQEEDYTNFGLVLGLKQPCSLSISPYESPVGWGFQITAKVIDNNVEYQRVMNYGDETEREKNWEQVIKE